MANSINATSTGNGGIITTGDDSGVLNIQTNETTAISIDASQNATFTNGANLPNTFGFKNRLINGGMQIWQRGTSGSGASTFVADRWYINSNNTTSAQSSDVPAGFRFSNLLTGTSAANAQLTHKVESYNAGDLYGQAITVSFWAKSTSGSTQLGAYLSYATVQDNFSSTTAIGSTTLFTLTSSWAQYTVTFTTNAPSGVANGLQLGLFRSGTESSATYITGVQLEKGTQATSFDFRSYGTELALCQRYFEKSYNTDVAVGASSILGMAASPANGYSTVLYGSAVRFNTTKRATPSVSVWSYGGSSGQWHYGVAGQTEGLANLLFINMGANGFTPYMTTAATSQNTMYGQWAASAEL